MLTRREALSGAVVAGAATTPGAAKQSESPEAALHAFLKAFEDCDLPRMEAAFAHDASYFDRAAGTVEDLGPYHRGKGMPVGMRQLALELPQTASGPPYHRVEPQNLTCEVYGALALCTFELEHPDNLGRRTVALRKQKEGWKIVHIHASNVYRTAPDPAPSSRSG